MSSAAGARAPPVTCSRCSTRSPFPVGFFAAWAADHIGTRRLWLGGAAALQVLSLLGVVLLPGAGWLWAVLLGLSIGPLFPLTMTLPLDAATRPAEVAALAGMMLGLGYTLSSSGPLILGFRPRPHEQTSTPSSGCSSERRRCSSSSIRRSAPARLAASRSARHGSTYSVTVLVHSD